MTGNAGITSTCEKPEAHSAIGAAAPRSDEVPLPVNLVRLTPEVVEFSRRTAAAGKKVDASEPYDPAEISSGCSTRLSRSSGAAELQATDAGGLDGLPSFVTAISHHEDMNGLDPRTSTRMTAEVGWGLSGCATIMLKNVNKAASVEDVATFLQSVCPGQIDYLYLPVVSRTFQHRGYAFVNFITVKVAERFYDRFHNVAVQDITSVGKVFSVAPADRQGFVENVRKHMKVNIEGNQGNNAYPLLWGRQQCRYVLQHWEKQIRALIQGPCGSVQIVPKDMSMASGQVNPRTSTISSAAAARSGGALSPGMYFSPTFEYLPI
eukprot:TRINITY_DN7745_c0_g6_i1.p1 TRINITY_DN7745_c0_g6~~TRINITY_DN7745_c0_g6_i1.p1  ORF type:complete len:321 (+),score=43.10 TRINITY_DN7745_c0_g6_i1:240-1202(+)